MNSEEIKQQGDEMVERYLPYAYYDPGSVNVLKEQLGNATRCAIRSCEDTIEAIQRIECSTGDHSSIRSKTLEIDTQKKIIEYLKTKLNG